MAVLYFENLTGDSDLDWLRHGLTEMLVTDLSQSPGIRVLGTDRLYQILKDLNRLDERITSFEVVQEVAERANVGTVLLGSFMKAGDTIRISVKIQEAASGEILTSRDVEGVGESSLFAMVDDLSRDVRQELAVAPGPQPDLDLNLEEVTTSSLEAYRFYSEGMRLHSEFKEEEAIELFEKAVELDPGFAMALARLSTCHGNLELPEEAEDYALQALEHKDRLTARERYYVEWRFHNNKLDRWNRAIQVLTKAIEEYPDDLVWHTNLAVMYWGIGRYEDAIEHYEKCVQSGSTFESDYKNLAWLYGHRGEFEKGQRVLEELLRRNPESFEGVMGLGWLQYRWGKLDEALETYEKAESLVPGSHWTARNRWELHVVREDWERAEEIAQELADSDRKNVRDDGVYRQVITHLHRGRSEEALGVADKRIEEFPDAGIDRAWIHWLLADILLARGEAARALEHAQAAQREGKGDLAGMGGAPSRGCLGGAARASRGSGEDGDGTEGEIRSGSGPLQRRPLPPPPGRARAGARRRRAGHRGARTLPLPPRSRPCL